MADASHSEELETWLMNKKQLIAVSTVAAIPGAALLVFLVLGLLQGMLSDTASVSVTLWIIWVFAAVGSLVVAFLPFAIMFFPGLMPEPAMADAGTPGTDVAPSPSQKPSEQEDDDDDEYVDDDEFDDDDADDDGEQLFEDDALEDDFDDDFDDEYGDSFEDNRK